MRDPQVKTPAPGLETGSHPKKRRHHGQPAPTLTPHSSARHRRPRPYGGSDPRPGTTCTGRDFHAVATIPRMKWLRRSVSAAGQPACPQVSRCTGLSASDRKYPALTGRSGTQRARRLRLRMTADSAGPGPRRHLPAWSRRPVRALSCPGPPPPNPTTAEPDGRRVLSGGGGADHVVTPQAPLTGSGCREHSYGGFGGGHPHAVFRKLQLIVFKKST